MSKQSSKFKEGRIKLLVEVYKITNKWQSEIMEIIKIWMLNSIKIETLK